MSGKWHGDTEEARFPGITGKSRPCGDTLIIRNGLIIKGETARKKLESLAKQFIINRSLYLFGSKWLWDWKRQKLPSTTGISGYNLGCLGM